MSWFVKPLIPDQYRLDLRHCATSTSIRIVVEHLPEPFRLPDQAVPGLVFLSSLVDRLDSSVSSAVTTNLLVTVSLMIEAYLSKF